MNERMSDAQVLAYNPLRKLVNIRCTLSGHYIDYAKTSTKFWMQLEILGSSWMAKMAFYSEDPKILGTTVRT
jgi:hypothetical protein